MRGPRFAWALAVALPPAVAVLLVPFRDRLAATNEALVLVVTVVAVAALGRRAPGVVAALGAGIAFDVFLTRPYLSLKIDDPDDVETAVLLLAVGILVTEIASWGRRHQEHAVRLLGYTQGVRAAVTAVDDAAPLDTLLEQVAAQIAAVLGLPGGGRFDYATGIIGGPAPRLRPDGQVEVGGAECDVERYGLPLTHDLEILLTDGGRYIGRFVITPRPDARPSLEQRLAAVTLADRARRAVVDHGTARR